MQSVSGVFYPVGNQVVLAFYLATRPLLPAELSAWEAGQGLPPGVAVTPESAKVEYFPPGATKAEAVTASATTAGCYQAVVEAKAAGRYVWRGVGSNSGTAVVTTPDYSFTASQSRSS